MSTKNWEKRNKERVAWLRHTQVEASHRHRKPISDAVNLIHVRKGEDMRRSAARATMTIREAQGYSCSHRKVKITLPTLSFLKGTGNG